MVNHSLGNTGYLLIESIIDLNPSPHDLQIPVSIANLQAKHSRSTASTYLALYKLHKKHLLNRVSLPHSKEAFYTVTDLGRLTYVREQQRKKLQAVSSTLEKRYQSIRGETK